VKDKFASKLAYKGKGNNGFGHATALQHTCVFRINLILPQCCFRESPKAISFGAQARSYNCALLFASKLTPTTAPCTNRRATRSFRPALGDFADFALQLLDLGLERFVFGHLAL
jgi:hypothetical protein